MTTRAAFHLALAGIFLFIGAAVSQPIGEVDTAGTTWYDYQHNGSCQRMIAVDTMGYAHVAWTNASSIPEYRHAFYNVWDPNTHEFMFEPGCQMDAGLRSGYVTIDCTPGGVAVPVGHLIPSGSDTDVMSCCDFAPRSCTFSCATSLGEGLWPHGTLDIENRIHLVTWLGIVFDFPQPLWYVRSDNMCGESWAPPFALDTVMNLAHVVATSRHSDRLAAGWSHPRPDTYGGWLNGFNSDAMIRISENGGDTWGPNINITDFTPPDTSCPSGDTLFCNRDTFRVYADMSLLFDEDDNIHAAFTVRTYYELGYPGHGAGPMSWIGQSGIYHWSESSNCFSLIADGFHTLTSDGEVLDPGIWQTYVQRPSLAIDPTTGYLYCSYMQYDSNCTSEAGFPMADVYISTSTDNGWAWSAGTNVTRTCPGENVPAPGSMHERDQTLEECVSAGFLHLFYEIDHDAGSGVHGEGVTTYNHMIYQRVPVDSIPTVPLVANVPIHVDSTGVCPTPTNVEHSVFPNAIQIHPAYPNPFNGVTTIRFDLPQMMQSELKIFDMLGREVETLQAGMIGGGVHRVVWDASTHASGLYFIVLKTEQATRAQKLMFLR